MLSEILATIIAFISIILLLSIVVTSLVQVSQAFLRLRGRNLMKGLAALLVNAREGGNGMPTPEARRQARIDATQILNAPNVALSDRVQKPAGWLRYWLTGPIVSWLEPDELEAAMTHAGVDSGDRSPAQFAEDFRKSEPHLKKRFLRMTRGWSVFWALVVAVAFQISAPALFNELASDTDRREAIVANAESLLTYHAEAMTDMDFLQVAPQALERLAAAHEQHRERIEEASGTGTTRAFVLDELRLALDGLPEQEALVAEYDALIDVVARERIQATGEHLQFAVGQLQQYDIELWPRGAAYYYSDGLQWGAIVGVLITGILLSFGGSFWFEQLRNVMALRDTLAGKRGREQAESNGQRSIVIDVRGADVATDGG